MDHESARAAFMAYHDRELPADERRALEEHLAACPDCRSEWEAYSRTVGEVSGLRVLSPSADFVRQVSDAIELRRAKRMKGGLSLNWMRVALLSLILILLGVLVYLLLTELANLGDAGPDPGGATKRQQGDLQIIGPVQLQQEPAPRPDPGGGEDR